jgi:hypothetical protein
MANGKNPAFMYYPKDWRADAVFGCSLAARGLWLEMMNMMHASERYGYLCNNGAAIPDEAISRYCGCSLQEYQSLLPELERAGVPRRTPNGIIYCKRMVDDQKERQVWRKQKKNQRDKASPRDVHPNVHQMSGALPFPPPSAIPRESSNPTFSQDQEAVGVTPVEIAAAFKVFHDFRDPAPFGDKKFQVFWTKKWKTFRETPGAQWYTDVMEQTIVEGKAAGVGIPPQFYDLKHEVEKGELDFVRRERNRNA